MAERQLTVKAIADLVGGTVQGDESVSVRSVAAIDAAGPEDLTFVTDKKYADRLAGSKAGAAIVGAAPEGATMPLVIVENVEEAVAKVLGLTAEPLDTPPVGIDPTAVIAENAEISPDAAIGPYVTVGSGSTIGAGCVLCAKVSVGRGVTIGAESVLENGVVVHRHCTIGERIRIGANSVIGGDGFGYYTVDGKHHPIPHAGDVVIEDDVSIGACVAVDRAKFGSTRIGTGSKIDNHVQIAHNVQVGTGCILCAHCAIAGSTKLGDYVVLGGNVGAKDNIEIGDGVQSAAFAAIAADVAPGQEISGIPAQPIKDHFRQLMALRKLPDLLKRVSKLEAKLEKPDASEDD